MIAVRVWLLGDLKGWESFREHPGAEVASDLIVTLCALIVY